MATSVSPISAAPAVPTAPLAPQPKGQRHRIIAPITPYIDIGKPVVTMRGTKTSMTVNTAIMLD